MTRTTMLKRLIFPILWQAAFLVAYHFMPTRTLYLYAVFYLGLIICFHKDYSFTEQGANFKDIKGFWLPVLFATIGTVLCHEIKTNVIQNYIFIPDGRIGIWMSDSYPGIILFALTTIILGPIAEELYFRKAIIDLSDGTADVQETGKKTHIPRALALVLCVTASFLLCGLSHATGWLGILEAALMVLPFTVCYIWKRNIYISILVHIGYMLYMNVEPVIYVMGRLYMR